MDEVKIVLFIFPFSLEILDNKLDIRSHPLGLDRADIISNDMGAREFPIFREEESVLLTCRDG